MRRSVIYIFLAFFATLSVNALPAQQVVKTDNKPYRILTSGRQITIKSTKNIQNVMVWSTGGHRVIEQKDINAFTYSFTIGTTEKAFFLMLELKGNDRYTEKIGVN